MNKSVTQFTESVEVSEKCIPWERSKITNTYLRNLINFKCNKQAAYYVQDYETYRQKFNLPSTGSSRSFNSLSSFCISLLFHLRIFFFLVKKFTVSKPLKCNYLQTPRIQLHHKIKVELYTHFAIHSNYVNKRP
jgi:hypothetical protein